MNTETQAVITSTHDEDGIVVSVEEYTTTDRDGSTVVVCAFYGSGDWVFACGWKLKKDGSFMNREFKTLRVAVPENVFAILEADAAARKS